MPLVDNTELEKYPKYFPRVYVYETAGPGALAWLRSCWERVFFGPKQYELEDLGERGLAFRCTLDQRFFGPTPQQEEKALATFKQAWEKLKDGWAKVLGNLSAQERENAPRYFDFLQLKTILPIYAPDGRYIEAWQALYELSLPLAPAQDSLPRPPRVGVLKPRAKRQLSSQGGFCALARTGSARLGFVRGTFCSAYGHAV